MPQTNPEKHNITFKIEELGYYIELQDAIEIFKQHLELFESWLEEGPIKCDIYRDEISKSQAVLLSVCVSYPEIKTHKIIRRIATADEKTYSVLDLTKWKLRLLRELSDYITAEGLSCSVINPLQMNREEN